MASEKQYSIKDMQEVASIHGGKCISTTYVNEHTKLTWQCNKGHTWKAAPVDVLFGKWCDKCNLQKKEIKSKVQKLRMLRNIAIEKGGRCLSTRYIDHKTKLKFQCKDGHQWEASPSVIKKGSWCPYCEGRKTTIEEVHHLAAERNGKCLSKKIINQRTKLTWQCEHGHTWQSTYRTVKRGAWCPECAGKPIHTIKDMQQLAAKRNGKCLSDKYINIKTKLTWQCEKGHVWQSAPRNIKRGYWCPECVNIKLKIEDMHEIAMQRNGKCLSDKYENNKVKLTWQCENGHVWKSPPNLIKKGGWCPECAKKYSFFKTTNGMHKFAKLKNGKCLSDKYVNSMTPLKWQCEHGHTWEATPKQVKRGEWCPECAKQKKKMDSKKTKPAKKGRKPGKQDTIKVMRTIAAQKKGFCLSKEYINPDTKLIWECEYGHIWHATPQKIKQGTWCPVCHQMQETGLLDELNQD